MLFFDRAGDSVNDWRDSVNNWRDSVNNWRDCGAGAGMGGNDHFQIEGLEAGVAKAMYKVVEDGEQQSYVVILH